MSIGERLVTPLARLCPDWAPTSLLIRAKQIIAYDDDALRSRIRKRTLDVSRYLRAKRHIRDKETIDRIDDALVKNLAQEHKRSTQ